MGENRSIKQQDRTNAFDQEDVMKKAIPYQTILVFASIFCIISPAFADIAPPQQPSGGNPGLMAPVDTMVEMTYEVVFFEVGDVSNLFYSEDEFGSVNADVTALFLMKNRGSVEENLAVVFPLTHPHGRGDGRFQFPEIRNFSVSVNESQQGWSLKESPNPNREDDPAVKWAEFSVTFPPEEIVSIEVSYQVQSTGYLPEATFYYVFETGAGWYGPIGEAVVYLTLRFEAKEEIFLFGHHNIMGFNQKTTQDVTFDGNRARWRFANFEPEPGDNWEATIIDPRTWLRLLTLQEKIEEGETQAYIEITKVYDEILFSKGVREGAEHFVPVSLEMYEQAMDLEPDNDDLYTRYAEFLLLLEWSGRDEGEYEVDLWMVYDAVVHALSINPENETAQWLKRELEDYHELDPANKDNIDVGEEAAGLAPTIETAAGNPENESGEVSQFEQLDISQDTKSRTNFFILAGVVVVLGIIGIYCFQQRLKRK
jgi:hypothetical protein